MAEDLPESSGGVTALEGFKDVFRLHLGTWFIGSLAVLDDQVGLIILEGFSHLSNSMSLKVSVVKYFSCALSHSRFTDGRQGYPKTEFYRLRYPHWMSQQKSPKWDKPDWKYPCENIYTNFYYLMPKSHFVFFPIKWWIQGIISLTHLEEEKIVISKLSPIANQYIRKYKELPSLLARSELETVPL